MDTCVNLQKEETVNWISEPELNDGNQLERLEIELLLEAIHSRYGYDFSNYSPKCIRRRILHFLRQSPYPAIADLIHPILTQAPFFQKFMQHLSITVTEMFRDPNFYQEIRSRVIPVLRTYPYIKIWHAGCATGEEVYSMAIILKEEGLLERSQLYATDFNHHALILASDGRYTSETVHQYQANYSLSGGKGLLTDYFTCSKRHLQISKELKSNIFFTSHNLVTDSLFGEMNVIFCRNVLIYFNSDLQNRVLNMMSESLVYNGFLCLGAKESLCSYPHAHFYHTTSGKIGIFQKKHAIPPF